jgi:hypothetical protein
MRLFVVSLSASKFDVAHLMIRLVLRDFPRVSLPFRLLYCALGLLRLFRLAAVGKESD